jgi:hypothetical protein
MDLRQLEYVVAVAEERSSTAAGTWPSSSVPTTPAARAFLVLLLDDARGVGRAPAG